MSDGNTNDSVYIQKLFTSRDNFTQGNVQEATANAAAYVGQEGRIWWNPVPNAFYYSNGNTPGGIMIGSSANSTANISVSYQGSLLTSNVSSFNFAGAGVVADSNPESEYEETQNKAKALIRAIQVAEKMFRAEGAPFHV